MTQPILLVPYMWVGDFVRCHTVVKLLNARFPHRPVDVLASPLTAVLADYMPGIRKAIVASLPRGRLALAAQWELARRLRRERYGTVMVMPRTWKSSLAPFLAGIPERTGFAGEGRFVLINDLRWGERRLDRMIDRCVALALPKATTAPPSTDWPQPELVVPKAEIAQWRERRNLGGGPVVALAPGSVASARRWPAEHYGELARRLGGAGVATWVLGGPNEAPLGRSIADAGGPAARDLTGTDLRDAILAVAAADAVVSNDSGLLHVAAASGTPTIGMFGPGPPYLSAPLNPLAAIVETRSELACRPCLQHVCPLQHQRCMREITVEQVLDAARHTLEGGGLRLRG